MVFFFQKNFSYDFECYVLSCYSENKKTDLSSVVFFFVKIFVYFFDFYFFFFFFKLINFILFVFFFLKIFLYDFESHVLCYSESNKTNMRWIFSKKISYDFESHVLSVTLRITKHDQRWFFFFWKKFHVLISRPP